MSQHKAGVAIYANESEVVVRTLRGNNHHTAIREAFSIRDDDGAGASRQTPVEFVPMAQAALLVPDERWDLIFDEEQPAWWTAAHTARAREQLAAAAQADWDGNVLAISGDLWLERITALPPDITITASGDIFMGSLKTIPAGVVIRCKDLYIGQVVEKSKDARIEAEGVYSTGKWRVKEELD